MTQWIEFATVGRPHGVRGEITVWPANKASDNSQAIKNILLTADIPENGRIYQVEKIKVQKDHWLVTLAGLDDRDRAALLTNCRLFVDRAELTPCQDGEIYLTDVMNFKIYNNHEYLGVLSSIEDYPQGPYLVISGQEGVGPQGSCELPWVATWVESINWEEKSINLALPEGLLELTWK